MRLALFAFAAWLVLLVGLWPRAARAEVEVSLSLGAREVAVGEAVQVRLDAMSDDDDSPSDPELTLPNGFEARGPSVGTRQQVSISGFSMVTQTGISATWLITATRPGLFSIGPATVLWKGQRRQAQAVQLSVLPPGQQPRARRSRRQPVDPFDSFDPFGNSGFDDLFDRLRGGGSRFDQLPAAPTDLVPDRAPDDLAFLDAHIDTRRAVVGQQVTLAIYAHGAQGLFQEAPGAREPSTPDFLAQRLVEDGSRQPVYQYSRDGQRWIAVKVREIALFPLRAGRLEIGALEFGFLGRRYGVRSGDGLRRTTRPIFIDVSEPPKDGRPPGYSGDVGNFELRASVEPRTIPLGGSVAVTARVKGRGRLPGALVLPEQAGTEWLEPTVRDEASVDNSVVGGTRSFSYLVRMTKPGTLDLGSLRLPLFDPATGRYRVATFALGNVTVQAPAAGTAPDDSTTPKEGPHLSGLVRFRPALDQQAPDSFWTDRALYWWWLGLAPSLVLGAAGLIGLSARVRRQLASRADSQATHATRALADARQALAAGTPGAVASAAERALYNAIEWSTGIKARAVLRSNLARELAGAGLPEDVAGRVVAALDAVGQLRFAAGDAAASGAVLDDVDALVKQLVRRAPRLSAR
ncbi:MAG TPA: BatD family protein, partial [Polyangiaceae bacterium]|nr:BatD family protein [Polyangiaceae bacterium]